MRPFLRSLLFACCGATAVGCGATSTTPSEPDAASSDSGIDVDGTTDATGPPESGADAGAIDSSAPPDDATADVAPPDAVADTSSEAAHLDSGLADQEAEDSAADVTTTTPDGGHEAGPEDAASDSSAGESDAMTADSGTRDAADQSDAALDAADSGIRVDASSDASSDASGDAASDASSDALDDASNDAGSLDSGSLDLDGSACGPGSGPTCNSLVDLGMPVQGGCVVGPLPTMTGGTILDGTYVLTSATEYAGAGGCSGSWASDPSTFEFQGACLEHVTTDPAMHVTTNNFVFATGGNVFTAEVICPASARYVLTYTATPTQLMIIEQTSRVFVYTKQ